MDASTSDLLRRTYRCLVEPQLWPAVLDEFCTLAGARSAIVQRVRRGTKWMHTRWCIADSRATAAGVKAGLDDKTNPRMLARYSPPLPGVTFFRDEDVFASSDPAISQLHDRLAAFGLRHFIGARIEIAPDEAMLVALHGGADDMGQFGAASERALAMFLPHLAQAVAMHDEVSSLHGRNAAMIDALGWLSCGIVLCRQNGDIDHINRAAEQVLATQRFVRPIHGTLVAESSTDAALLRTLIGNVAMGRSSCSIIGEGKDVLKILGLPVGGGMSAAGDAETCHQGRVMLLISTDAVRSPLSAQLLERLYGLTRAEGLLTAAICEGVSLRDYAERRGVSVFTARYQLKQVLAKTGAARQSDLVRLICNSAMATILDSHAGRRG